MREHCRYKGGAALLALLFLTCAANARAKTACELLTKSAVEATLGVPVLSINAKGNGGCAADLAGSGIGSEQHVLLAFLPGMSGLRLPSRESWRDMNYGVARSKNMSAREVPGLGEAAVWMFGNTETGPTGQLNVFKQNVLAFSLTISGVPNEEDALKKASSLVASALANAEP